MSENLLLIPENPHFLRYQFFGFLVLYVFANPQPHRYNQNMHLARFLIVVHLNHTYQITYHFHLIPQPQIIDHFDESYKMLDHLLGL